jgi:hypothetical protein
MILGIFALITKIEQGLIELELLQHHGLSRTLEITTLELKLNNILTCFERPVEERAQKVLIQIVFITKQIKMITFRN